MTSDCGEFSFCQRTLTYGVAILPARYDLGVHPYNGQTDRRNTRVLGRVLQTSLLENETMNEDRLNMSIRKFLKEVGVSSQREIEKAIRVADASDELNDTNGLDVRMTLTVSRIGLSHQVNGRILLA
tara:strand:+ start:38 stop:418 length:381 start_codon:yes stop_codon:yes gene_type:complete